MKIKIPLLCLFAAFSAWAKPIVIKGKINGKLPNALHYTAPVNGALGFDFYYTALVNFDGNFEINTNSDQITFIDIYYNYQAAGYIVATPGETYGIAITETDGKITHTITGKDAEGQKMYNIVLNGQRMTVLLKLGEAFSGSPSAHALQEEIRSRMMKEILQLHTLYEDRAISGDFYTAVSKERRVFYGEVMCQAIAMNQFAFERGENVPDISNFRELWTKTYESAPPDKAVTLSPWGKFFLDGYKSYRVYQAAGFDHSKLPVIKTEQEAQQEALKYIPKEIAEYYCAVNLCYNAIEGKNDKSLLDAFDNFKKLYPKSSYTPYIKPKMEPLMAFFAQSGALPQGASYVENYAGINTLEELIKKFPGKKLYVDVWATWCGPCREEFKHKDELYKLLKAHDITVIYISLDKENKDETWKKMIGHYGLGGYHLRAGEKLDDNITFTYSGAKDIGLPWHFLVNTHGQIAVKYAASPAELDKLEAEIKNLE
jgi:thiol-disulfide isomerase/thioredoxin